VEATNGKLSRKIECDYLACAYGLVPNIELAQLAGCRIENGFVAVDEHQRTSVDRIFCAGEPVAIGGVDAAIVQGTIAGLAASGRIEEIARYEKERAKAADFAFRLVRAFALRDEVLKLAEPDTIVCRCEDARYGELEGHATARAAKLHTRCGMGACQGRICGAACRALFGWEAPTVRPPLVPVPLESMAEAQADSQ
jgi:D-hydroxyproline dehydrogenase subunit alpha